MAGVLDSMSYMYTPVRKRRYKWYFTFTQFTFFIQVLNTSHLLHGSKSDELRELLRVHTVVTIV